MFLYEQLYSSLSVPSPEGHSLHERRRCDAGPPFHFSGRILEHCLPPLDAYHPGLGDLPRPRPYARRIRLEVVEQPEVHLPHHIPIVVDIAEYSRLDRRI